MDQDFVAQAPLECCRTPGNAPIVEDHPDAGPGEVVRVCNVCGSRHFQLTVDPGHLGLKGAGVG